VDGPSNAANRIFSRATLVATATKFGTYGLELGLRERYIEDLGVRWGAFEIRLFEQCAIIQKCTYAPRKNHTLNIRKIVII